MVGRVMVGGIAGLAAVGLLAGVLHWPSAELRPPWTVVRRTVYHRVLIVEVVAARTKEASRIAEAIVDDAPAGAYDEVLVYVSGRGPDGAVRRIQWTPHGGYAELVIRGD